MNTPAEYARVAEVYAAVYDLPREGRAARLAELCGDDRALRLWVEDLLAADDALQAAGDARPEALLGVDAALLDAADRKARFASGEIAAGRYRITDMIGRGGASEVYGADDLLLQQPVALKFLARGAHEGARAAALLNEVRLARRVRHPNVCQVFDVGEAQGARFLSMEYVGGSDLAQELRRIGRFARPKAIQLAHQLCAGLAAIHQQGIVHGDLKPANVMLDERGDVRIVDFGISEARQWTLDGLLADPAPGRRLMGTPAYVAPECWRGESTAVRSDLYALGLVLYEIFTGARAFDADSAVGYRAQHETAVPPPASTLVDDIDPSVEAILERCLAKQPDERPASALEVARALPGGDALGGLVLAGVVPSAERVAEGANERPLARRTALALALLFVVLLAVAARLMPLAHLVEASDLPLAPVALADRADGVLRALGSRDTPHTAYGFSAFVGAPELLFWYRASPEPLRPTELETSVELADPPFTEEGMAAVVLTPSGALRSFLALGPSAFAVAPGAAPTVEDLFERAGLEFASFAPVEPAYQRFLRRGQARAWLDPSGGTRVSASEENGRLFYFEVVEAGRAPLWGAGQPRADHRRAFGPFVLLVALAALVVATVLGWRNLRRGSVDRLGARRTALAVLLLAVAHGLTDLINTGAAALDPRFAVFAFQRAALFGSATWILYAALEPLFRRYWPHGLVSWARLVRGRFRDPILGRDVLIGACLGCVAVIFDALRGAAEQQLGIATPLVPTVEQLRSLVGPWGALGAVLAALLGAVLLSWVQFSLLVLLRRLLGGGIVLVLGYAAVLAAGAAAFDDEPWWAAAFQLGFWLIATPFLVRFGFTVMATMAFVFLTMTHLPTTLDPTQWYFPTSVAGFGMLLALAAAAAWACVAQSEAD